MTASVPTLAHRIAAELNEAAEVCRRAEGLAAGLAADGAASLDQLAPLQSLDELTQRLESLAAVLAAVGDQAPANWTLTLAPLLDPVRLGGLADRLRGDDAAGGAAGEAEIF